MFSLRKHLCRSFPLPPRWDTRLSTVIDETNVDNMWIQYDDHGVSCNRICVVEVDLVSARKQHSILPLCLLPDDKYGPPSIFQFAIDRRYKQKRYWRFSFPYTFELKHDPCAFYILAFDTNKKPEHALIALRMVGDKAISYSDIGDQITSS